MSDKNYILRAAEEKLARAFGDLLETRTRIEDMDVDLLAEVDERKDIASDLDRIEDEIDDIRMRVEHWLRTGKPKR